MPRPARQVIFLMTDTQRKDMLGCYADTGLKTPSLDRLAAGGIRFDRAYTCQPVCGPARSALFTGTFPHSNGSWTNCMPLGDTVRTLGQRLADGGVHTAYIGKWHLDGSDYFGLGRCPPGWDPASWYDMRNYLEELSPEDRLRSRNAATNRQGIAAEFTFGHRCSNRAVDYLQQHTTDDFLLVVSYDEPHHPYLCPEPYASMYHDFDFPKSPAFYDDLKDKPAHQRAWSAGACDHSPEAKQAARIRNPDYFGCNSFIDSEIGRVLDAAERLCPGALVVYTSDHGDGLGEHGISNKGAAMYDSITNIPLLVRWPGQAPAGAVCPHPVSHIDLVPTLLEFFGAPLPRLLEGASLMPCLRDPLARVNAAVYLEFARYETDHDGQGGFQPIRCVFDGRFKLVINLLTSDELYDLASDPYELTNLIASPAHGAVRDALHDRLIDWMNRTRDPFRGYYWLNRPWRTDAPPPSWRFTAMTRQREEEPRYEPRQLDYETGLEMVTATRRK